ncbi:FAD:protein FMN transferase [Balneolales bacterium ANBcel1]|nr:FAD:protein FMN transferase [Balneolales bacterium ANBcel1]
MNAVYHNSFYAMGTRCHMVFPGMDEDAGERVFGVVRQEVNRVESSLSRFIPYSEIAIINKNAGKEPVQVSEEIFDILTKCRIFFKKTRGAFDISMRPVLEYWKQRTSDDQADLGLYETMDATGMSRIQLDENERTVAFENDSLEIDLGGFGKGYALERCRKLLQDFSVKDAFISFGESSVLAMGRHPAGDCWRVGLNNYSSPGQALHTFDVTDASVSTSSNFFVDDYGKLCNHRHVINPFSGYPVERCMTVSVCSASPVVAEVLSTAFLVSSEEVIKSVKEEYGCDVVKTDYAPEVPEKAMF